MDKELVKYFALLSVLALILWAVIDKIFGISKSREEDKLNAERRANEDATKTEEAQKLIDKGMRLSAPPGQYDNLANRLYSAMSGIGTDENTVLQVFSNLKNNLDFLALDKSFGIRDGETLIQWLHSDGADTARINQYLRSKGITYTV